MPVAFYWRETLPVSFQDFPCVNTRIKYSSRKVFCCSVLPEVAK